MEDQFGVSAKVAAFDKRHGGNPVPLNSWFYYSNGAMREMWTLGALCEPPENDFERLTNVLRYHQARHRQAVEAFEECKEQLLMSGGEDREGFDRLKELQAIVGERNQAVRDAQAQVDATEEGRHRLRSKQMDSETKYHQTAFLDKVRALRI